MVLNGIISLLAFIAFTEKLYEFHTAKKSFSHIKIQLEESEIKLKEAQSKWTSITEAQAKQYEYIRNWREQDKTHFKEMLCDKSSLKDTAYKEYLTLNSTNNKGQFSVFPIKQKL